MSAKCLLLARDHAVVPEGIESPFSSVRKVQVVGGGDDGSRQIRQRHAATRGIATFIKESDDLVNAARLTANAFRNRLVAG